MTYQHRFLYFGVISLGAVLTAVGAGYGLALAFDLNFVAVVSTILVAEGVVISIYETYPSFVQSEDSQDEQESFQDFAFSEPPNIDFSDIFGMDNVKEHLREQIIEPVTNSSILSQLSLSPKPFVILYGQSGTGKTFVSRALARELKYKYISITPAEIFSPSDSPEKQIQQVFQIARNNEPCILIFDEFDSVLREKGSIEESTFIQFAHEVNSIRGGRVIIVATVNSSDGELEQIVRDFANEAGTLPIHLPLPDPDTREEILKIHLRDMSVEETGIDIESIIDRTDGFSHRDMAAVASSAARKALVESREEDDVIPIRQKHLLEAINDIASQSNRPSD